VVSLPIVITLSRTATFNGPNLEQRSGA